MEKLLLLPLICGAFFAYWATPLVIRLAWKLDLIDDPKKNKHPKVIHDKPIPRAGGLATLVGIVVTSVVFLPLDKHLIAIITGAILLVLLGLADDKWKISPYLRLIGQFAAASIPIISGIGIDFITNPLGQGVVVLPALAANIFALFWLVSFMNFLNMGAKGVDGQLPGTVAIASFTIAILSLRFSADIAEWPVIILAAAVTGSYLGFLPWNFYPQKIMPAMSGSNLGGYMLGILSILTTAKVGTLLIVLAVPLIDTGYAIVRRIMQGKSPVWGDRGHLHHHLLDLGWSKRKVAIFYWLVTGLLGFIALNLNTLGKLYTMAGITLLIGGIILWLTYQPKKIYQQ